MDITQRLKSLLQSGFVRATGTLVSGSVLANAITMLALPLLTRIYTPADFSDLAVLTALIATLSVSIALRLDVAIPLPASDREATNIAALALTATLTLSAMIALVFFVWSRPIAAWLNRPHMHSYLMLVPLAVVCVGAQSTLQYWLVRRRAFASITRTRVAQSVTAASSQIGMGLGGAGSIGILIGPVVNFATALIGYAIHALGRDRSALRDLSADEMRRQWRVYDRFPKYSSFEALANNAGIQAPLLMIAALATGPEAGFLLLGMTAMQAPMALIGAAVSQVYLASAPDEHRAGRLAPFTLDILRGLAKAGIGPILFAGLVAPDAMAIIFGEPWRRAGILVAWMTPWFAMQFLASPISTALLVTHALRAALMLQVAGLALRVAAVASAARIAPAILSEAYALSGFVFYFGYLAVVSRVVGLTAGNLFICLRGSVPFVAAWLAAGCALRLLLQITRTAP